MATKNLIINNELGPFTFNEGSLNALEGFLVYAFPLVNKELYSSSTCDESSLSSLDKCYCKYIDDKVRSLVRNLYNILHHSK